MLSFLFDQPTVFGHAIHIDFIAWWARPINDLCSNVISPNVEDTKNSFNCTLACEVRVLKAKLAHAHKTTSVNNRKVSELQLAASASHPAAG